MPEVKKIQCKNALGKCGFPGGGLAINPYVGCKHGCVYCYARFMKIFSGHADEKWGSFVDARMNIAESLKKQLEKLKDEKSVIYIGTVTDPYQPVEREYQLTKSILKELRGRKNPIGILTKSDLILRDLDLLKELNQIDVNFF